MTRLSIASIAMAIDLFYVSERICGPLQAAGVGIKITVLCFFSLSLYRISDYTRLLFGPNPKLFQQSAFLPQPNSFHKPATIFKPVTAPQLNESTPS